MAVESKLIQLFENGGGGFCAVDDTDDCFNPVRAESLEPVGMPFFVKIYSPDPETGRRIKIRLSVLEDERIRNGLANSYSVGSGNFVDVGMASHNLYPVQLYLCSQKGVQ